MRIHYYVYLHFRMSLFENNSAEGDLVKLHTADHNMNSPAGAEQSKHFPYSAFPSFPFLPAPLSLNLTGQLGQSSPSSAQEEEESPKSSPTGESACSQCLQQIQFQSPDCLHGPFVFWSLTNIFSEIHCLQASI